MATRRWREEAGFEMSIYEQLMDQVWEVRGKGIRGGPGVLIKHQCGCQAIYYDREDRGKNRLALRTCAHVYRGWIDKSKEMSSLNCIF